MGSADRAAAALRQTLSLKSFQNTVLLLLFIALLPISYGISARHASAASLNAQTYASHVAKVKLWRVHDRYTDSDTARQAKPSHPKARGITRSAFQHTKETQRSNSHHSLTLLTQRRRENIEELFHHGLIDHLSHRNSHGVAR